MKENLNRDLSTSDEIETLNPNNVENTVNNSVEYHAESFSGPIPHPNQMAEYEKITPGLADRIMKMAEENQSANIIYQQEVLKYQARDNDVENLNSYKIAMLSIIVVFIIMMTFIIGGMIITLNGATDVGMFSAIGGLGTTLYIFNKLQKNAKKQNDKEE